MDSDAIPDGGIGGLDATDYAKSGAMIYGVLAAGVLVTVFLATSLADATGGMVADVGRTSDELFAAVVVTYGSMMTFGPLVGLGFGFWLANRDPTRPGDAKNAATAAGLGSLAVAVVLAVLVKLTEPGGASFDTGDLLLAAVAIAFGSALVAAASARVRNELPFQ